VNLVPFGIPSGFQIRGSVVSHRLDGRRLLILFGERHSVKASIRANLLNAVDLANLNAVSCVGVEGWSDPCDPFPCEDMRQMYQEEKAKHEINVQALVDGILQRYRRRNFLFWKVLTLLLPSVPIESVEDSSLFMQVAGLECQYFGMRKDAIAYFLRASPLFEPDHPNRDTLIEAKALAQADHEFAEHDLNVERDDVFIEKMLSLWLRNGGEKPAILNAGSSHQYRIARRLRTDTNYVRDVSYVHIEQP
jgi:hypothetical protein